MPSDRTVFVLGDSISLGWGPHLEAMLPAGWRYDRKGKDLLDAKTASGSQPDGELDDPDLVNGGDSTMVLAYLKERLQSGDFRPDVLLLNCGLHDIKRADDGAPCQVPLKLYRKNLESILMLCKARGLPVVWVRTTPLDEARHRHRNKAFIRLEKDHADYQATADRVMNEFQVGGIDLCGFTLSLGAKPLFRDHVHFPAEVERLQGAHIAGALAAWGHFLDRRRTSAAG